MRQIIYAMRFEGRAAPASPDGKILRAATSAPSSTVSSVVGADGLTGTIEAAPGGMAAFESEVTFTGEASFLESGTIAFGNGHRLRFSTVGQGYVCPGPDCGLTQGTAMWRVESGEGQFEGATGLITSNAVLGEDLAVIDHQFGVLFLP